MLMVDVLILLEYRRRRGGFFMGESGLVRDFVWDFFVGCFWRGFCEIWAVMRFFDGQGVVNCLVKMVCWWVDFGVCGFCSFFGFIFLGVRVASLSGVLPLRLRSGSE
jgi:hypothetical protein